MTDASKNASMVLKCEICGREVNNVDELTDYDGLLVDDGYQTCDGCTKILEKIIKMTVKNIRDNKLRNSYLRSSITVIESTNKK